MASRGGGRSLREFVGTLARQTIANELTDMAAQLAFNAMLAVFPFAIFLVTVIGFLPIPGLEGELKQILHVMPPAAAALFDETVETVVQDRHGGLLTVSLLGSMWAASGGVASLASALNRAYGVREHRSWLHVRLLALGVTLGVTVFTIIGVTALLVGPGLATWIARWFGLGDWFVRLWLLGRWPATVMAMSIVLGMLYWACPDVRRRFRLVTPGSLAAIPLWIAVSLGFNLYMTRLGEGSINRTYGTLGAGVVLMLWFYLSGLIVLLGGEMNALARAAGTDEERESH